MPYAYWNLSSKNHELWDNAKENGPLHELPENYSAKYASVIEPISRAGVDALAVTVLTISMEGDTVVYQRYRKRIMDKAKGEVT